MLNLLCPIGALLEPYCHISKFVGVLALLKFNLLFSARYWSQVPDVQEFIRRMTGMFRWPSFRTFSKCSIPEILIFPNIIVFEKDSGFVIEFLRYLGVSKDKWYWSWGSGTRPQIPKSWKWGCSGSPITKSKSYKCKLNQNNITELLSISSQ